MNRGALRDSWEAYAKQNGLIQPEPVAALKRNKFNARKVEIEGKVFASQKEGRRFVELRTLERAGKIDELECQPEFPLHIMELWRSGPIQIRTVGRFRADFRYRDLETGEIVVEDTKSGPTKTEAYMLRKKVAEAVHGIYVREV